jgi:hypothetical protein
MAFVENGEYRSLKASDLTIVVQDLTQNRYIYISKLSRGRDNCMEFAARRRNYEIFSSKSHTENVALSW